MADRALFEAAEILARLRARFRRFEEYARKVLDYAGLNLEVGTPLGWRMQCPSWHEPAHRSQFSDAEHAW